ncbi:KH domain containing, RNA binding, signal transduction associated [Cichlidogyrus casuarinus]|uniref:KH domain containing, RNA binding, signal transduction associated n=1 Tax=Cichlidogyrus casuarinus TaxID=1844966 RepID=A0ABD2QKI9_9PLAT
MADLNQKRDFSHPESEAFESELRQLDAAKFPTLVKWGESRLYEMRGGVTDYLDLVSNKKTKVRVKVDIPCDQSGTVNYVGRLLGPRGTIFRQIQEVTHTRMAILGKGSMRNDQKEQELLHSGEQKFQHLKQKLHMQIDCYANPVDAYYNIWCALCESRKILTVNF